MLSTDPVRRLSMATTSSPRRISASQMCDPTNPAPPVTTTRATSSAPSDGVVGEAPAADSGRVEKIAGIDQAALRHQPADLLEVEPPELVPLGEHEQHRRPFAGRVGVGRHLQAVDTVGDGGVVSPDTSTALLEAVQHLDGGGAPQIVGPGLERQAPRRDQLVLDAAAGHAFDLGHHPVELLVVDLDDASQEPEVISGVLGNTNQRVRILGKATPAPAWARFEELEADAAVVAHAQNDLTHIGAHCLADVGD